MDTTARQIVEGLRPAEIRERLNELAAEEKALRVLLRAALARERVKEPRRREVAS
jgi:hypothetical protein